MKSGDETQSIFSPVAAFGGKSLGPCLLLPLFSLMTVASIDRIDTYLRGTAVERTVGGVGGLLVTMAMALHIGGTIPAYCERTALDSNIMQTAAAAPSKIVVTDDPFTAQLLFPMYYRKIILPAHTPQSGKRLGSLLAAERILSAVLVTRRSGTDVSLSPYRMQRSERRGRMTIQYWRR